MIEWLKPKEYPNCTGRFYIRLLCTMKEIFAVIECRKGKMDMNVAGRTHSV